MLELKATCINCNSSLHFAGQAPCYNLGDPISINYTAVGMVRWITTVTSGLSLTVETAVVGQITGLVSNVNNSKTLFIIKVESVNTTTNTLISSLTGTMSPDLNGANVSYINGQNNTQSIILQQCDGMIAANRASCYCIFHPIGAIVHLFIEPSYIQWYWHVAQVLG